LLSESNDDDWDNVYLTKTKRETTFYTKFDILLDNEASLNIFSNRDLLENVVKSQRQITMTGVEVDTNGVVVDEEGTFCDVGQVYYSAKANANMLSFATQIDTGARIVYDDRKDVFTMQPKNRKRVYTFGRKRTTGSGGRLYSCDVGSMINGHNSRIEPTAIHETRNRCCEQSKRTVSTDVFPLNRRC
jgi:hypothetical protein